MAAHTIPPHQLVANAVTQAFHNWGSKHAVYKKVYKKVPEAAFIIVSEALSEIPKHEPGYFHHWYSMHHMRYYKKIRQEHVNFIHELMYHFLTAYCKGRLKDDIAPGKKKKHRQIGR